MIPNQKYKVFPQFPFLNLFFHMKIFEPKDFGKIFNIVKIYSIFENNT